MSYSILFAPSISSLILLVAKSMLCRCCGLCSLRNEKSTLLGIGGSDSKTLKNQMLFQRVSTLVAHCSSKQH